MRQKKIRDNSQIAKFIQFLNASVTPFHAVEQMRELLTQHEFNEIKLADSWKFKAGEGYFTTPGDSTLVAFIVGNEPIQNSGFHLLGAHTDSPVLKIKPQGTFKQHGYLQVGVEDYGGVLLSTWLDRDLTLAGRVFLQSRQSKKLTSRLVHIQKPLLRIPNLAIHLNREVNEKGLLLNKQQHLPPILSLLNPIEPSAALAKTRKATKLTKAVAAQQLDLEGLLKSEMGLEQEEILGFDLSLCDTQSASLLGSQDEFLVSPRLDNLFSCFIAIESLVKSLRQQALTPHTRLIALFDNEEIGSTTKNGANSALLKNVMQRIAQARGGDPGEALSRSLARSFFISADMAHALHPNYSDRHEPQHHPQMNQGIVIKANVNGRYATDGQSRAVVEALCRSAEVPTQNFVNRTDLACGSTIGPMLAADLGIPAADLGAAMLSMHSIREMCGVDDLQYFLNFLEVFWEANLQEL